MITAQQLLLEYARPARVLDRSLPLSMGWKLTPSGRMRLANGARQEMRHSR